jgi:hypothetical protein
MQTIADICPSQFMDDFGRSTRRALHQDTAEAQAPSMLSGPAY